MHGLWKRPVKAEHWEGSMLDAWVTFFRTLMSTAPAIQGSETDVQDNSQGWLVRCDSQWVVHHLGRLLTSSGPIPSLILEGCDWTGLFMFSDHVSFVDSSPFSLFLRQLLCSRCNLFNLSRSYMVDRGYGKLFRPRPLPQEKIALFFFQRDTAGLCLWNSLWHSARQPYCSCKLLQHTNFQIDNCVLVISRCSFMPTVVQETLWEAADSQ